MVDVTLLWKIPSAFRLASMVAGLSVIIVFCMMSVFRPSLADRISLRLVFAACISGVTVSIWQTVLVFLPSSHIVACLAGEFFLTMNDTVISLFLMFVGVNLMLLVVFRIPPSKKIEYGYYMFSGFVGLVNGLIVVLYTGSVLPEKDTPNCWFYVYYSHKSFLRFALTYRYSFSIIIIIICTVVFTSTIFVLYSKKGWIHQSCDLSRPSNSSRTNQRARRNSRSGSANSQVIMFKKVVVRCMLYPAVLIMTNIWGFIYFIMAAVKKYDSFPLLVVDQCIRGSIGLLISLIFFSDPAVKESTKDLLEWLHTHYVDEYAEHPRSTTSQRRKSVRIINVRTRRSTQVSGESITVDRLVQYSHPKLAKYTNWILKKVFRWKERPRKCRSFIHFNEMKGTSIDKVQTGSTSYLPSVSGPQDICQMDVTAIPSTDLPPPELAVTNDQGEAVAVALANESSSVANSDQPCDIGSKNIRELFDKYSISSNDEVTDDEVPHFPTHVLNEIQASPTLAPNAAHIFDPHDDSEDDFYTVNSADLDLEAVGKDGIS